MRITHVVTALSLLLVPVLGLAISQVDDVTRIPEPETLVLLAAGGIASLDDLRALRDLGCEGAVVGSALWRGDFSLADATRVVAQPGSQSLGLD